MLAQDAAPKSAAPTPPAATVPAPAAKPVEVSADTVVLSVGDTKMTKAQFDQLLEGLPEQVRNSAHGPQKRAIAEQLVRVMLLSQQARKDNLEQKPSVQAQMQLQKDNVLANAEFQELLSNAKADDDAVRKYYDDHKAEYEQAKASHILIKVKPAGGAATAGLEKKELTDEEALAKAQEIRKRLLAGEDFAKVAKAESDDPGSAAKGGDLGFFHHGQMVAQFEQAAFSLPIGQLSEPVKSPYGYHIIKVEARETKPLEEVKADIEKRLRPEMARKAVEELRKSANVTLDESFFGPAQVPVPLKPSMSPAPAPAPSK